MPFSHSRYGRWRASCPCSEELNRCPGGLPPTRDPLSWPILGLRDGHSEGACQSIDCKAHKAALHRAAHWRGHSTHTQQPAPISDPPDASTNVTGHARVPISTMPPSRAPMPTSLSDSCASALRGTSSATPIPTQTSTASATRPPTMTTRTTTVHAHAPVPSQRRPSAAPSNLCRFEQIQRGPG